MISYAHGANTAEFARAIGVDRTEIIDFSSNINFVKPYIPDFSDFGLLYPYESDGYLPLKQKISAAYGISDGSFELYNGASVAIFSLFSLLSPSVVSLYTPIYSEYKKISNIIGSKIECIDRMRDTLRHPAKNSVVVFVNPSTPDGTVYDVKAFLPIWSEAGCTVIADESFLDFTDGDSVMGEVERYDNLYVVKSMTKYYGAAGVRVGFVASCEKNIQKLQSREPLWKLSGFDAWYISKALEDSGFNDRSRRQNGEAKAMLCDVMESSGLFSQILPSSANYICIKLKNNTAKKLQERLSESKILIRDCSNFDGLDEGYARFAVREPKDIETLKFALRGLR